MLYVIVKEWHHPCLHRSLNEGHLYPKEELEERNYVPQEPVSVRMTFSSYSAAENVIHCKLMP